MDISNAILFAAEILKKAGVADPRREAASLLAFTLDKPNTFLIAHPEYELTDDESKRFASFVARREKREPYQYITGRQEFYGLEFEVTPDVLIPRPETEILVEEAIRELNKLNQLNKPNELRFCEIGVGSGCISVSILKNVPTATAVATDISAEAIAVARRNAEKHGVLNRLEFLHGDLFADMTEKFDMIVSNPPYIPDRDLEGLQLEVRDHEPHSALFAGNDGMRVVRDVVKEAPKHLRQKGILLMEIGLGQHQLTKNSFDPNVWTSVELICDLQNIQRLVRSTLV